MFFSKTEIKSVDFHTKNVGIQFLKCMYNKQKVKSIRIMRYCGLLGELSY
jgi:hypothetical protein